MIYHCFGVEVWMLVSVAKKKKFASRVLGEWALTPSYLHGHICDGLSRLCTNAQASVVSCNGMPSVGVDSTKVFCGDRALAKKQQTRNEAARKVN
jgi:hypothetical protein